MTEKQCLINFSKLIRFHSLGHFCLIIYSKSFGAPIYESSPLRIALQNTEYSRLLRGFQARFEAKHSGYTEIRNSQVYEITFEGMTSMAFLCSGPDIGHHRRRQKDMKAPLRWGRHNTGNSHINESNLTLCDSIYV